MTHRIEIGSTHVTVTSGHNSKPLVAKILHRVTDPESGADRIIYLDRLLGPDYISFSDWRVKGAIATELHRNLSAW